LKSINNMTVEESQKKGKELGHCPCSKLFECPCPYYKNKKICHCAGEPHPEPFLEWVQYNIRNK